MTSIRHLRERVTLQKRARVLDAFGGYIYTWATEQTVWARVEQQKPKSSFLSNKNTCINNIGKTFYSIQFRHGLEIKPETRLKWRGLHLQIMGEPIRDPFKKWLEVIAYSTRRHV
jgi:head-tail adaptor